MKTCPFCGAALQDEAKFCLYCMRELEPKATVTARIFSRRRLWLSAAAALLIVSLFITLALLLPHGRRDFPRR